jgi:protein-tyrosine phosphatase
MLLFLILNKPATTSSAKSEEASNLSLDFENKDTLPLNFRKTSDLSKLKNKNLDLIGLDTLNISGSAEFTSLSLLKLKEYLNTPPPIVIIDLRQESHGFINGNAISYFNPSSNAGLTLDEINKKENQLIFSITFGKSILLSDEKHSLVPTLVETEEKLIRPNNLKYFRIPVKEGERPTDEMVDRFVNYVTTLKKNTWLHFHCKMGDERTTTFMTMYDMIKNSNNTELNNIISRQETLGETTLSKNDSNVEFMKNFYQYTRNSKNNFKTTWSEWIKQNNIKPYTSQNELPN